MTAGTVLQRRMSTPDWVVLGILTLGILSVSTVMGMPGPLLVPIGSEFGQPVGQVGQLAAVTSLPWALSALVAAPLSDRFGRKGLQVAGYLLCGLGCLAGSLAPTLEAVFVIRALVGLGLGATGPIALAYVGDYFSREQQSRAFGWVLSGFPLGAILGVPAVALVAGYFGWRWSFALAGLAMLAVASGTVLLLPGLPRQLGGSLNFVAPLVPLLRRPTVVLMLVANLGERGGTMLMGTFLPSFLISSYGLPVAATAVPLIGIAGGALAGSWLGGRLADRFDKPTTYAVQELTAGLLGLPLFLLVPTVAFTTLVAALQSFFAAAGRPSMLWLVSQESAGQRGAMLGLYSLSNQVAFAFAIVIGGSLVGEGSFSLLAPFSVLLGLLASLPCVGLSRVAGQNTATAR